MSPAFRDCPLGFSYQFEARLGLVGCTPAAAFTTDVVCLSAISCCGRAAAGRGVPGQNKAFHRQYAAVASIDGLRFFDFRIAAAMLFAYNVSISDPDSVALGLVESSKNFQAIA
jgi:hypothetical protein